MVKHKHHSDRLYLNAKEFAEFWGGYKDKSKLPFRTLPFNCCALSLQPFTDPVCTKDGHLYEIKNIVPYIKKYGKDPCDGKPLKIQDLHNLTFHKNSEGKFHCPVTFKEFTDNTHIVANRKSGHVYEYTTIDQLCRKTKSWKDLITGEAFSSSDLAHLNNPTDEKNRLVAQFVHVLENHQAIGVNSEKGIRSNDAMDRIFKEKRKKEDDAAAAEKAEAEVKNAENEKEKKVEAPPPKRSKHERFTSNEVAASFTSTSYTLKTNNALRDNTDEEERQLTYDKVRKAKKKGYARIVTNMGNLNIELHCDIAPTACDNFIRHSKSGYYNGTKFHRLIKNFMLQGGDPTGTGKGGESSFEGGDVFKDELDCRLKHDAPGILSMANQGIKNTNRSQFFITFREASHLDLKHTIFGRVVGGKDILKVMNEMETDKNDKPLRKISIVECCIFNNPFEEVMKEEPKKKDEDSDAMWFNNKSDPMQNHAKRNDTSVGKYISKTKSGLSEEEKIDAMIPVKRKQLRMELDFASW